MLLNQAEQFSRDKLSLYGIDTQLKSFLPYLEDKLLDFMLSVPIMLAKVFLTLVISYFILKDRQSILNKAIYILPLRTKTMRRLITEFKDITHTVIYAQLFVAVVQGTIGAIGFFIFGVPFPLFLGVVLAFCALIPTIGTAIIWVPASLFLIASGYFSHNHWVLGKGVALFFYGLIIISTIDNILLAKLVHAKAHVNQVLVIVGVIGGASLFGVPGIFIGPILLPLLITYFETFKQRFV